MVQLDEQTTFLQSEMKEEVYVRQPVGFEKLDVNGHAYVYKLMKSLYGLKQSPPNWLRITHRELIAEGFKGCICHPCIYVKSDNSFKVFIVLYLDDLLMTGSSEVGISKTKAFLMTKFTMKYLEDVSLILGIQVSRDRLKGTLDINQGTYVNAILQRYGLNNSRSVSTPGSRKPLDLKVEALLEDVNKQLYQEIVGSLIYLSTCTRWDIAYSVVQLTRAMSNPRDEHIIAAKRVLRHLEGTPDLYVRYWKDFTLHGYSDASHSDDPNNYRSVSGYLYMFAGGPVTWSSKKQPVVAFSSCESEYIALVYESQEAVHLSDLLSEPTFPQFSSVQMSEDNMGALQLSGTTAFSSRTKHICTRYHFLRELVASNKIIVFHVKTADQV